MNNIMELKDMSDVIAECDENIRDINESLKSLEAQKISLQNKKDKSVWQLQDKIDELSKN